MSVIFRCDRCKSVYESGFTGQLDKVIRINNKPYEIKINIRPPHLCKRCLVKCLTMTIKDIKSIKQTIEIDQPVAEKVGTAG